MKTPWTIIRRPVVTEKSYKGQESNIYTFIVDKLANKIEIKNAVEQAFGVKVESVRTAIYKGKRKKMRNLLLFGKRKDWKKAFVRLKKDYRLDIM